MHLSVLVAMTHRTFKMFSATVSVVVQSLLGGTPTEGSEEGGEQRGWKGGGRWKERVEGRREAERGWKGGGRYKERVEGRREV